MGPPVSQAHSSRGGGMHHAPRSSSKRSGGQQREHDNDQSYDDSAPKISFDGLCPQCDHCQNLVPRGSTLREVLLTKLRLMREPVEVQLKREKEKTARLEAEKEKLDQVASTRDYWEGQYQAANASATKYKRQLVDAESNVKQLSTRLELLEKRKNAIQDELSEERSFTKQLQAEKKSNEKVLGQAQSVIVSKLTDMVSAELSDDRIRDELEALFKDCQEWARENYRTDMTEIKELKARLVKEGVLTSNNDVELHHQFDFGAEIIADILLEAVLNHELCLAFIAQPYNLVRPALWEDTEPTARIENDSSKIQKVIDIPASLKQIDNYLQNKGSEKAINWRSETIKIVTEDSDSNQQAASTIYLRVARSFIKRWDLLVRHPVNPGDLEWLVDLISRFAELTSRLWSLKVDIQCYGLEYFGKSDVTFQGRSIEMLPAQVLGLEEGSKRLDGRPIPLVLQPKIDASPRLGNGKAGSQRIIWAPGVVWVSDQTSPKPDKSAPTKTTRQQSTLIDEALTGGTDDPSLDGINIQKRQIFVEDCLF